MINYNYIKKLCSDRNITMLVLCKKIGMTPQGLRLAFKKKTITFDNITKIANVLNLDADDLSEMVLKKKFSKSGEEFEVKDTEIHYKGIIEAEINSLKNEIKYLKEVLIKHKLL